MHRVPCASDILKAHVKTYHRGDIRSTMPTSCPTKRACDQCHTLKEKCRRTSSTAPCQRCSRLGQSCQTARTTAKAGRKPRGTRKLSYTLPQFTNHLDPSTQYPTPYDAGLGSNSVIFADLDQWERHFLNLMKKEDTNQPSPLDKFLVGPSFHESHHISFIQNLIQPTPELKNASVACAAVLFGEQSTERYNTVSAIGHKRAALAVSSLRSFQLRDESDLTTILVLSVAMITFAMHVENGQQHLIAHYTLTLIKQAQGLIDFESPVMDLLMCLVCTETFECLLKCKLPTWRVDGYRRGVTVDRYLGLSYPLFCHFYDICEMGTLLRCGPGENRSEIMVRVNEIHAAVDQWHPSTPVDFLERFTQAEVVALLAQAKILQLAALLIIHRLRFPFGQRDSGAQILSQAIIYEFHSVIQLTGRSVPCTALAYLTACFEVAGEESRECALTRSSEIITFSKQAQIKFESSLTSIWKARDSGNQFYWFEMGKYLSKDAGICK